MARGELGLNQEEGRGENWKNYIGLFKIECQLETGKTEAFGT